MADAEDADAEADEEDGGGLGGALPGGGAEGEGATEVDGEKPEEGAQATLASQHARAVQAERGHAVAEGLPEGVEECLGDGEEHRFPFNRFVEGRSAGVPGGARRRRRRRGGRAAALRRSCRSRRCGEAGGVADPAGRGHGTGDPRGAPGYGRAPQ